MQDAEFFANKRSRGGGFGRGGGRAPPPGRAPKMMPSCEEEGAAALEDDEAGGVCVWRGGWTRSCLPAGALWQRQCARAPLCKKCAQRGAWVLMTFQAHAGRTRPMVAQAFLPPYRQACPVPARSHAPPPGANHDEQGGAAADAERAGRTRP